MMRWLPLLLLLAATPASASVIYVGGFEMGDPHINGTTVCSSGGCDIAAIGAGNAISQVHVRTGAWSYAAGQNFSDLILGLSQDLASCRFYLYIPSTASSSGETWAYLTGNIFGFLLRYDGTNMRIMGSGGFTETAGSIVIAKDTWNRIDAIYDRADGGIGKVYVNNVLDINLTHTGTNGIIDRIHATGTGNQPDQNHYFDDVYCTNTLALSPDGATIVRQGTTGTPIDNAFTKVNCTNIEDCWSNTGYTTTTNANSGATNLQKAQTMIVAPFSTTQAGHGTEVLHSNDTINVVWVVGVAKNSGGGTASNMRRYVNGAGPTDTAVTMNTVDRAYRTAFFTDTIPNLDLYEIGWMTPATGAARTQTVEDMWMLVDFLTQSGRVRHRVNFQ